MLSNKIVVLGVTGSIAAYKAAELASQLTQRDAKVNVIMTKEAIQFVSPITFRAITGRPVVTEMFELASEFSIEHVSLAEAAGIVVIAPATANIIAKLAAGIADDMLCCTVLATKAPVVLAPAMDVNMYENTITQDNLSKLKARNFVVVGPVSGRLASGKKGLGRFADVSDIIGTICQVLGRSGDLAQRRIVVTAGGTQEPIDPVRYISNRSSGKMGYALAEAARDRGAKVTLITAPTLLSQPVGVEVIHVGTAQEMYQAVKGNISQIDALIMAAAVADYRPAKAVGEKIKKREAGLTLELELTEDILGSIKGDFVKVGFAAESSNLEENARQKLREKKLDLIVANDITVTGSGFGADSNQVTIIDREGRIDSLPLLPKQEVADKVLDKVAKLLSKS
ncbi:MAG: bifunctional phosphopantothenoylcysteine decarboxylase/phosphopantothenate--cysteine ligase CoaBC [Chloroflexi bacterium CG08_land_8_20_14_0_20_45_12]|nr:MAG: bifunctional phosphopantothenoylcysteine decarboxylase/phosphopantothenate--cysteine ligase CoaBC [Chloroflexi bacterium CG08_land_8_20_14_0_20_45_12]